MTIAALREAERRAGIQDAVRRGWLDPTRAKLLMDMVPVPAEPVA